MSSHFATHNEIASKTVRVNVSAAIRALNEASPDDPEALRLARRRASELCPAGGPLVFCNPDGTQQVVDDDSHSVTFASTGKGKTRRFVYPSIFSDILAGTNIVVNDMKGEIYETTRDLLDAMGYQTYVFDLRDPGSSPSHYNPLSIAWEQWHAGHKDAAFLSIRSFGLCLFGNTGFERDPFWNNSALDYFTGLALSLLECNISKEEFTFENVALLDLKGGNSASPGLTTSYELRDEMGGTLSWLRLHYAGLGEQSLARRYLTGTIDAPSGTKTSIYSVFRQPISLFVGHLGLMSAMSSSDFTAESLTNGRTAVFVISPDETHVFGPVVVSVLNQLMAGLITIAQSTYGGVLPQRVDFFLDEMGNLPAAIPDMEALVSAARSRNLRFNFVLQSKQQLANVYGDKLSNVIIDNCDTWVYMGTKSLPFLQELSELCGTIQTQSGRTRALLPVEVLQRLDTRERETETLVRTGSLRPYVTALQDIGTYTNPARRDRGPQDQPSASPRDRRPIFDYEGHVRALVQRFEKSLREERKRAAAKSRAHRSESSRDDLEELLIGAVFDEPPVEDGHASDQERQSPKEDSYQLNMVLIHEPEDVQFADSVGELLESFGMNVFGAPTDEILRDDGTADAEFVEFLDEEYIFALAYIAPQDPDGAALLKDVRLFTEELRAVTQMQPLYVLQSGGSIAGDLLLEIASVTVEERLPRAYAEKLRDLMAGLHKLCPFIADGAITQLEHYGSRRWLETHGMEPSRQIVYDAIGTILCCRRLEKHQKDRLWKLCEAEDSLLTYKQRETLRRLLD